MALNDPFSPVGNFTMTLPYATVKPLAVSTRYRVKSMPDITGAADNGVDTSVPGNAQHVVVVTGIHVEGAASAFAFVPTSAGPHAVTIFQDDGSKFTGNVNILYQNSDSDYRPGGVTVVTLAMQFTGGFTEAASV